MTNVERLQHVSFRIADAICSGAAFSIAYITLTPIQNTLIFMFPDVLRVINRLVPGSATGSLPPWHDLVWIGVVVTLAMSITLEYGHDARPISLKNKTHVVLLLLAAIGVSTASLSTVFYALHVPLYSRLFVFSYLFYLLVLTVGYRLLFRAVLLRQELAGKHLLRRVIAGSPEGISLYVKTTEDDPNRRVTVVGCLSTDDERLSLGSAPRLGHVATLGDLLIQQPIDEVVIVLSAELKPWLGSMIEHCDSFRVSVHLVYESLLGIPLRDLTIANKIQTVAAVTLIPEEDSLSGGLVWKRLVDVVLSAAALVVLFPIMAAVAIAIKLTTPNLPIFYTWSSVGYRGRHFKGYKFTTMVANAELQKEALAHLNEMQGPVFKIKNDPRLTPIGKFLRKYDFNELPQFWSVLKGDMSLVGPRPALPKELKSYELWHKRRLSVRPGITCFWQVRGRNAITSFDDWVRMDLEYIQKRSMRTDLFILLQTVKVVLSGTGS